MAGQLIGFSGKIASGKSTLAREVGTVLFQDNVRIVAYADALKDEVNTFIELVLQDKKQQVHTMVDNVRMEPSTRAEVHNRVDHMLDTYSGYIHLGVVEHSRQRTPQVRAMLQYWGTDVRRFQQDDYWIAQFNITSDQLRGKNINVLCDDVRFPNEADNIKRKGGHVVRIVASDDIRTYRLAHRDNNTVAINSTHPSEVALDNYNNFDVVYYCTDTLTTIEDNTLSIIELLQGEHS